MRCLFLLSIPPREADLGQLQPQRPAGAPGSAAAWDHRRRPVRRRRGFRLDGRMVHARAPRPGPPDRHLRGGQRPASGLPPQPRQGRLLHWLVRQQRRRCRDFDRSGLQARSDGGVRPLCAGRRRAGCARRAGSRAQHGRQLHAAGRRDLAFRHERHPGLPGEGRAGLLRPAAGDQSRRRRQARSGTRRGLPRGPSGIGARSFPHQGRAVFLGFRQRELQ